MADVIEERLKFIMESSNSLSTFKSACTIAYLAREKLGVAAEEADQDLRVLVAHAHLVNGGKPHELFIVVHH